MSSDAARAASPSPSPPPLTPLPLWELPQCRIKRNYACNGACGGAFATRNPRSYLYHLRDAHGQRLRVWECARCTYASRHAQKLQRHMHVVHGDERSAARRKEQLPTARPVAQEIRPGEGYLPSTPPPPGVEEAVEAEVEAEAEAEAEELEEDEEMHAEEEAAAAEAAAMAAVAAAESRERDSSGGGDGGGGEGAAGADMGSGPYRCSVCPFCATSRGQIMRHEALAHLKKKFFRCNKCSYATHLRARFTKHVKYHSMPMIKCSACDFRTPYKWNLDRHSRNHGAGGAFRCSRCDFTADIKQSLTVHELNHHAPLGADGPAPPNRRRLKVGASDALLAEEASQDAQGGGRRERVRSKAAARRFGNKPYAYTPPAPTPTPAQAQAQAADGQAAAYRSDFVHPDDFVQHKNGNVYFKSLRCRLCPFKAAWVGDMARHEAKVHGLRKLSVLKSSVLQPTNGSSTPTATAMVPPKSKPKTPRPLPNLIPIPLGAKPSPGAGPPPILRIPSVRPPPPPLRPAPHAPVRPPPPPPAPPPPPVQPPSLTQRDMDAICAKSRATSALKDFASIIGEEDDPVDPGDAEVDAPAEDGDEDAEQDEDRLQIDEDHDHDVEGGGAGAAGVKGSFLDALGARLLRGSAALECRQCGVRASCLSELERHRRAHQEEVSAEVDPEPEVDVEGDLEEDIGSTSPIHPPPPSSSRELSSTRCQRCRQRCKTSADLLVHLRSCTAPTPAPAASTPAPTAPAAPASSDQPPHPMENRVFVWNNRPEEEEQPDAATQPDDGDDQGDEEEQDKDKEEDKEKDGDRDDDRPPSGLEGTVVKKVFKCPHCAFWASTASRFHVHIVGHLNKKPFECSLCMYRSNWRWDITKHIRLKATRDAAHGRARVLMTDETGRRNYAKYNKYLTLLRVREAEPEPSSASVADPAASPPTTPPPSGVEPRDPAPPKLVVLAPRAVNAAAAAAAAASALPAPSPPPPPPPPLAPSASDTSSTPGPPPLRPLLPAPPRLTPAPAPPPLAPAALLLPGPPRLHPAPCKRPRPPPSDAAAEDDVAEAEAEEAEAEGFDGEGDSEDPDDPDAVGEQQDEPQVAAPPPAKRAHYDARRTLWKCKKCNYKDSQRELVLAHVKQHYQQRAQAAMQSNSTSDVASPISDSEASAPPRFKCGVCGQVSHWKHVIQRHCRLKHDGNVHVVTLQKCPIDSVGTLGLGVHTNEKQLIPEEDRNNSEPSGAFSGSLLCPSCPFSCVDPDDLNQHQQYHQPQDGAIFKCYLCPYYVNSKMELHDHLMLHGVSEPEDHLSKPFENKMAASNISSPMKLDSEAVNDSGSQKRYRCAGCPYVSNSKSQFLYHKQFHRPRGAPFKCGLCSYSVSRRHLLHQHLRVHGILIPPQRSPVRDFDVERRETVEDAEEDAAASGALSSDVQDLDTRELPEIPLVWVVKYGRYVKLFKCRWCPHVNQRKANIVEHEKMHRRDESISEGVESSPTSKQPPPYRCPLCNYGCHNAGVLSAHMKVHQGACGTIRALVDFTRSDAAQLEELGAPNDTRPPLLLPQIGDDIAVLEDGQEETVDFRIEPSLSSDQPPTLEEEGVGEDPKTLIFCQICPARFLVLKELLIHKRFHEIRLSHRCESCSYTARQRQHLLAHFKVHSDEYQERTENLISMYPISPDHPRPRTAVIVEGPGVSSPVWVVVSDGLSTDPAGSEENSYGEDFEDSPPPPPRPLVKQFSCTQCPAKFFKSIALEYHKTLHGGTGGYSCSYCDYRVKTFGNLVKHEMIHERSATENQSTEILQSAPAPAVVVTDDVFPTDTAHTTSPLINGTTTTCTTTAADAVASSIVTATQTTATAAPATTSTITPTIAVNLTSAGIALLSVTPVSGVTVTTAPVPVTSISSLTPVVTSFPTLIKPKSSTIVPISGTDLFQQREEVQKLSDVNNPKPPSDLPVDPQFGTLMHGNPEFVYPMYFKNGRLKEKRYKCHKCPSAFEKREQYKVHLSLHGSKQRYKCDKCDYSVKYFANFIQHQRKHQHNDEAHAARRAAETTSFSVSMEETEEPSEDEPSKLPSLPPRSTKTIGSNSPRKQVLSTTEQQVKLLEQVQESSNVRMSLFEERKLMFKCGHCPYTSTRRDALESHTKRHAAVSGICGSFVCEHCDYSAPQMHFLREHVKLHFDAPRKLRPDAYTHLEKLTIWMNETDKENQTQKLVFEDKGDNFVGFERFYPPLPPDLQIFEDSPEEIRIFVDYRTGEPLPEDSLNSENVKNSSEGVLESEENSSQQKNKTFCSKSDEIENKGNTNKRKNPFHVSGNKIDNNAEETNVGHSEEGCEDNKEDDNGADDYGNNSNSDAEANAPDRQTTDNEFGEASRTSLKTENRTRRISSKVGGSCLQSPIKSVKRYNSITKKDEGDTQSELSDDGEVNTRTVETKQSENVEDIPKADALIQDDGESLSASSSCGSTSSTGSSSSTSCTTPSSSESSSSTTNNGSKTSGTSSESDDDHCVKLPSQAHSLALSEVSSSSDGEHV